MSHSTVIFPRYYQYFSNTINYVSIFSDIIDIFVRVDENFPNLDFVESKSEQ